MRQRTRAKEPLPPGERGRPLPPPLAGRGAPAAQARVRGGDDAAQWEAALRGVGEAKWRVHVTRAGQSRIAWVSEAI